MPEVITKDEAQICPSCGAPGYAGHAPNCLSTTEKNENVDSLDIAPGIMHQIGQGETQEVVSAPEPNFDEAEFKRIAIEIRKVCTYSAYQASDTEINGKIVSG